MKKIISLALVIMAGAGLSTAQAAKKDKKATAKTETIVVEQKQPVVLTSERDSVNYSAGQAYTIGMDQYIKTQLGVKDEYMADFIEGLKHGLSLGDDDRTKAIQAGEQIANMIRTNMLPRLKGQLEGTADSLNAEIFKRGFIDAVEKDASVLSVEEAQKYFDTTMKMVEEKKIEMQKEEGKKFLEENAKKEGVVVLPSGLQYKVLTAGNGKVATADDEVVVRYEGKLLNGHVFDSSYKRTPDTTSFKPTQVIKGWTEALQLMPAGSTWELYIPYDLAYGERGTGRDIPPYATLIFKVEVVEVK